MSSTTLPRREDICIKWYGMVGSMIDVGLGRIAPQEISEILQTNKRTARVVSAPAKGLIMEKVFYRLPKLARTVK